MHNNIGKKFIILKLDINNIKKINYKKKKKRQKKLNFNKLNFI